MRQNYPFSALVGQEELFLGLLLNVINPELGGLLIKGVKGSGKSTAVQGLSDIIPDIKVFKDCEFNCNPAREEEWCDRCKVKYSGEEKRIIEHSVKTVTVPLSITEDRLLGTIDIERLLQKGEKHFIPGILSLAHRQILYIDEVNLLPDHIVDDILDVSAMGWNRVEREGFSVQHPAKFLLIGTMNPEEGELRPQILDRFPLSVDLKSVEDSRLRKEIIQRNLAFEHDAEGFIAGFKTETEGLRNQVAAARAILDKVRVDPVYYDLVVKLGSEFKLDGHRADIVIIKTARAQAALEMRSEVEYRHIRQAAHLALGHRTREGGLSKPLTKAEIDDFFDQHKDWQDKSPERSESNEVDKNIRLFTDSGLVQYEKK
ncbi:MAG: ATP-binding protein [Candidatus Cloacimonetes bacterium]|nr:ATP-binding protein [Candidatus Cloacimonadota bacterium]